MLTNFLSPILMSFDSLTGGKADDDTSCCSIAEKFVVTLPGAFTEDFFSASMFRCCSFNVRQQNEGFPVLLSVLYGENVDAATSRAKIVWLTLSTVVSVAMASTLNSVTVSTTVLALMHLLVVCDVVVFTNFL